MTVDDAWDLWLDEMSEEQRRTFDAKRMSFEAGYERGARSERARREQNPSYTRPELYATCPGCGDRADAAHMAACGVLKRDELTARGWERGAEYVLAMVKTQLGRRGAVDVEAIAAAIVAVVPTVRRFDY